MKAIICTRYGTPDVLELREVETPTPKDNEVLIAVHASTVTSGDSRIRRADPFMVRLVYGWTKPKTPILGNEVAGVVESVGKDVTRFKKGDQVFAAMGFKLGGNAEYVVLPEDGPIALKPTDLSYEEAAAIPFGATTSLFFLRDKGNIQPGQQVLINGASGSLGTAAVQLARYFGAEVTAVCSGANAALVRSLGAQHVVDYTKEDFTTNGKTYDIIFDTVGKISFAQSKRRLKPQGVFLAAAAGLPAFLQMAWTSLFKGKRLIAGVAPERQEDLVFLRQLIDSGKLKAVIDRQYPLEQTAEAHRYVDKGHKRGNVVITLNGKSFTA